MSATAYGRNFAVCLLALLAYSSFASFGADKAGLDQAKLAAKPKIGDGLVPPIHRQAFVFNEANGRTIYLPLALSGRSKIKLTIYGGADDTGDKGLTWKLMDSGLETVLASGFARATKAKSFLVKDIRTTNPVLVIEDLDTRFSGKKPGNGFAVAVSLP